MRPVGVIRFMGRLLASRVDGCARVGKGNKRTCTVSPRAGAFPPSSAPLQPVSAASRLSSLSKRWPCEVEVGEWPRLAASVQVSRCVSEQISKKVS